MKSIVPFSFSEPINGVQVKPLNSSGKNVRIRYLGHLAGSGSRSVIMHFGFGNADKWTEPGDRQMEKTGEGWETTISMHDSRLNFCFRDDMNNWDNNNSTNWLYLIS